jgi:heme/copper-type cytochrome/quinol oxidase subunit 3
MLIPLIALVLAVLLAVDDWRYKLKGGTKPTRGEKTFLLVAILAFVVLEASAFWFISASTDHEAAERAAHGLGAISAFVLTFFFLGWQVKRWRIRRANPLLPARKLGGNQPTS